MKGSALIGAVVLLAAATGCGVETGVREGHEYKCMAIAETNVVLVGCVDGDVLAYWEDRARLVAHVENGMGGGISALDVWCSSDTTFFAVAAGPEVVVARLEDGFCKTIYHAGNGEFITDLVRSSTGLFWIDARSRGTPAPGSSRPPALGSAR
jgi:hypothetical protein